MNCRKCNRNADFGALDVHGYWFCEVCAEELETIVAWIDGPIDGRIMTGPCWLITYTTNGDSTTVS